MQLEQQVCNLELSKRLKELGAKQDSLWWWVIDYSGEHSLRDYKTAKLTKQLNSNQ